MARRLLPCGARRLVFAAWSLYSVASGLKRALIVYVEGNIASGKSELLAGLSDDVRVLPEPIDIWEGSGALDALYTGRVSPSYFQMMVICTHYSRLLQALAEGATVIVCERSVQLGAQAFANLCIVDASERLLYDVSWRALATLFEACDCAHVFIDVPAETCLERLRLRGRPSEGGIDIDYLRRVEGAHRDLIRTHNHPVYMIDGAKSQREVIYEFRAVFNDILDRFGYFSSSETSVSTPQGPSASRNSCCESHGT